MEVNEFIKKLDKLSRKYHYEPSYREGRIVLCRKGSLLTVPIEFFENEVEIYLYSRTTSWDGDGDRTDMNDVFSTLPALFLRLHEVSISCRLLDIEHPLGQGEDSIIRPVELYGRYLVFTQPYPDGLLPRSQASLNTIDKILITVTEYEMTLYNFIDSCETAESNCIYQDLNLYIWATTIVKALQLPTDSDSILYNKRVNPNWYYFRSKDEKISVIFSPKTAFMLRQLVGFRKNAETYESDGYTFYKSDVSYNSFHSDSKSFIKNVVDGLGDNELDILYIPVENRLIAVSHMHVFFLECECGKKTYYKGRDLVIKRRKCEQDFLFSNKPYSWADEINGERFEELTREILIRRRGVIKVSSTSITNEPDANADLICIWDSSSLSDMPQDENVGPVQRRKIVVQCKAWAKNIGKNDIPNIRDTLDRFDADGMLIVVSKSVTRSLFDHVEALKRKGIWADYWDRAEIESYLDNNPDLISKYSDVVSYARSS